MTEFLIGALGILLALIFIGVWMTVYYLNLVLKSITELYTQTTRVFGQIKDINGHVKDINDRLRNLDRDLYKGG